MLKHRLLPPTETIHQTVLAYGRSYTGAPGQTIDVPAADAGILEANGWGFCSLVGTTAQRPAGTINSPATPDPSEKWLRYFDTDLAVMIQFDGAAWRSVATGAAV